MKAVILAAGRGNRMMPLTQNTPKPLLKVSNKAILDHILELLPKEIDEIIIVVNYLGDQIIEHIKSRYSNKKINFVWQKDTNGTAMALKLVAPLLRKEKFLVMFADDFHSKKAIKQCLSQDLAILVKESSCPERFGVVSVKTSDKRNVSRETMGEIENIIEKPKNPRSNLVNVGVYVLDSHIFKYKAKKHPNGEYYLTDLINQMARDYSIKVIKTDFWLPIGYPDDLKKAEEIISENLLGFPNRFSKP